jgi:hypothetical protein
VHATTEAAARFPPSTTTSSDPSIQENPMSAPTEPVPVADDAQGRELASYEQREPLSPDDTTDDTMTDDADAFDDYFDSCRAETQKIYDIFFDHDYYLEIVGDGAQGDSYIDSVWEHAEYLAMSGRTAADILAADELAHDREQTADEDYRDDDDERLDEDTDLHSGHGH